MVRIVLVEPEYEINVGHCARVMANFGFDELWIVRPKCKIGKIALMYAKHASPLLKRAKIVKQLNSATRGCLVVGTTAIKSVHRDVLRTSITPEELTSIVSSQKIAILFGREGTGLTKDELSICDVVVRIPTSQNYPTMNISHALAVILYVLSKERLFEGLSEIKERKILIGKFNAIIDSAQGLRNPAAIKLVWRRVLARGLRSALEARTLLQGLKCCTKLSSSS